MTYNIGYYHGNVTVFYSIPNIECACNQTKGIYIDKICYYNKGNETDTCGLISATAICGFKVRIEDQFRALLFHGKFIEIIPNKSIGLKNERK
jgi:hypothetical protein